MTEERQMKRIAMIAVAITMMSGCMMLMRAPSEPSAYATTQVGAAQKYRATFSPAETMRVGKLHQWNIEVESMDGAPIDEAQITVEGGMPQHGHGLPTKPIVTQHLGDGKHVIEGMKFNMGGWWVVKLQIDGAKGSDVVTFNLKL
jgi:hypothetical protein